MLQAVGTHRRSAARLPMHAVPNRVVVINDVSEARGGATHIALQSVSLLNDRGIPVTYFTGDSGSASDPRLQRAEVVSLGHAPLLEVPKLQALGHGLYNVAAKQRLAGWIAANDTPDTIYHLHGWSKVLSPSVFRALRPVSARLVISAHDFFLVCPNGGYFDFRSERPCELRPLSVSCLLRSCDRRNYAHKLWRSARHEIRCSIFDISSAGAKVLAVHEGMLPHLERGGIRRECLVTLRNPVTPWQSERINAEQNSAFLFVGRLEEDKGVDLFLAAAREAKVPVRVIGGGRLHSELSRSYPEAEWIGRKSARDIPALVRDARALVMPSRYREPYGLVAFEALASGLPVIVSQFAMIADEIVGMGAGVACNPYDRGELSSVLSMLSQDDALVESMSKLAHANASRFAVTPAEWLDQLLANYSTVLRGAAA